MKLLVLLAVACIVAVNSVPLPSCAPPPPPPPSCAPPPVVKAGSAFMHQDHAHSASGVHGDHYHKEGGQAYFDKKMDHRKTKQVTESESTSQHIKGGSSHGSASGGSYGAFNAHDHGSMTAGSQYHQIGHK